MSYNTKTVAHFKEMGYLVEITEHYNAFSRKKNDFMGFADAIALNPKAKKNRKVLGVQITSRHNISARYNKITALTIIDSKTEEEKPNPVREKAILWLKAGNGIVIVGWDNEKPKNKAGKIREVILDGETLGHRDLTVEMTEGVRNGRS